MANNIVVFKSGKLYMMRALMKGIFPPIDGEVIFHLYENSQSLNADKLISDFDEVVMPGYSPWVLDDATEVGIDYNGNASWQWAQHAVECTSNLVVPQLAFGYFVTSDIDGTLLWGQSFAIPAAWASAGDLYYFPARLSMGDCCNINPLPLAAQFQIQSFISNIHFATFAIESWLVSRPSRTFAIASILAGRQSQTVSVASVTAVVVPSNFFADSLLADRLDESFAANSLIASQPTRTFAFSSVLADKVTQTFAASAVLASRSSLTLAAASVLAERKSRTFASTSVLASRQSATVAVTSVLASRVTKTVGIDSLVSSLLLYDRFIDTNGTLMSAHTKDKGPAWTIDVGSGGGVASDFQIQSNSAQSVNAATASVLFARSVSGFADVTLRIVFQKITATTGVTGIYARALSASSNFKIILGGTTFQIVRTTGGSGTSLGASAISGVAVGVDYTIVVVLSGNTITATLSGAGITTTTIGPVTDAQNNTTTNHGIHIQRNVAAQAPSKITSFQCWR